MFDASLDSTDRATCVCETRAGGLPGFDYGNGLYVLRALRQPLGLPRPYVIDRSGPRRVRFGVDPERDRKAPNTMRTKTQNWAARTRRELARDPDSRRRSEAIATRRSLNARRTDRAGIKADRFGPGDPRFAYLTRTFD